MLLLDEGSVTTEHTPLKYSTCPGISCAIKQACSHKWGQGMSQKLPVESASWYLQVWAGG